MVAPTPLSLLKALRRWLLRMILPLVTRCMCLQQVARPLALLVTRLSVLPPAIPRLARFGSRWYRTLGVTKHGYSEATGSGKTAASGAEWRPQGRVHAVGGYFYL